MTAIIDYGMGNIHSVQKALESLGEKTIVAGSPQDLKKCQKAVLPGVGAFDDAMSELNKKHLIPALVDHIKNKKIFLGICLGMQILFEASTEAKVAKGLGLLKGRVERFQDSHKLKVPHMGWNQLKIKSPCLSGRQEKSKGKNNCPLLKDIPDGSYVYFCHSYYPQPKDEGMIAATTDYETDFASVVWQDNIYAVQFHPEKSQEVGLKILNNFVKL